MLEAYTLNANITNNQNVPFSNTYVQSLSTQLINNNILLKFAGIYKVDFTANITPSATGTATFQLYSDGNAMEKGIATANVTASETTNLSFSTTVKVVPTQTGIANIHINYEGTDAVINEANIIVQKMV